MDSWLESQRQACISPVKQALNSLWKKLVTPITFLPLLKHWACLVTLAVIWVHRVHSCVRLLMTFPPSLAWIAPSSEKASHQQGGSFLIITTLIPSCPLTKVYSVCSNEVSVSFLTVTAVDSVSDTCCTSISSGLIEVYFCGCVNLLWFHNPYAGAHPFEQSIASSSIYKSSLERNTFHQSPWEQILFEPTDMVSKWASCQGLRSG